MIFQVRMANVLEIWPKQGCDKVPRKRKYLRLSAKHMYVYFSLSMCEFACVAVCSPYACGCVC